MSRAGKPRGDDGPGDERRMVAGSKRPGSPIPPPAPKPKPPPKPKEHPERTHRESQTIGGPGIVLAKGEKLEGNMPNCTLTPDLFTDIVDYVRAGNFRTVAMRACGVPRTTFFGWISTGREQIEAYVAGERPDVPLQAQLVIALDRAEGKCFADQHEMVLTGTQVTEDGDVLPADIDDRKLRFAWLQRRFARDWSPPTSGVDDETGAPKKIDVTELLIARLQMLKDADG
jgi:hypothetical protein